MTISIRLANANDIEQMCKMAQEGLNEQSIFGDINQLRMVFQQVIECNVYRQYRNNTSITNNAWIYVLCNESGTPLAFSLIIDFVLNGIVVKEIVLLQVKREYRGNGYGSYFIENIERLFLSNTVPIYARCLITSKTMISILEKRKYTVIEDRNFNGLKYIKKIS